MKRRYKIKKDQNVVIPLDITSLSSSFIRSCHTIPKKEKNYYTSQQHNSLTHINPFVINYD